MTKGQLVTRYKLSQTVTVRSLDDTPFTHEDLIRHYAEVLREKGHYEITKALAWHDQQTSIAARAQAWENVLAHDFTPLDEYWIVAANPMDKLLYVGRDRRAAYDASYDWYRVTDHAKARVWFVDLPKL